MTNSRQIGKSMFMLGYIWQKWDELMWWNVERIEGRAYASYEVW